MYGRCLYLRLNGIVRSVYKGLARAYSYVMVDNKADTSVHRQIVNDVFGSCMSYKLPGILKAMAIEAQ